MMAEVKALRASMRAEESAKRSRDGDGDGDEKPRRTKTTKTKSEGASFLQELVARNVGTVRGSLGGAGEGARRRTDDEKSAAATRSGVVKIVEVKRKNGRDGDGDFSRNKKVVATGRDAFLALLGEGGAEAAGGGGGAWGGGGWEGAGISGAPQGDDGVRPSRLETVAVDAAYACVGDGAALHVGHRHGVVVFRKRGIGEGAA